MASIGALRTFGAPAPLTLGVRPHSMHAHESERLAYRAAIREFDALVSHLMAISDSLVGKNAASTHQSHCEQILLKLLTHCLTLRKISPDPSGKAQKELWDLPSVSAIARCIIEAHDAFLYIGEAQTSDEERQFRLARFMTKIVG